MSIELAVYPAYGLAGLAGLYYGAELLVKGGAAIARRAGVHLYIPDTRDPAWIGNDLVFIHTATAGEKRITVPRGRALKRLVGPLGKDFLRSGEAWRGEAGETYGFLIVDGGN